MADFETFCSCEHIEVVLGDEMGCFCVKRVRPPRVMCDDCARGIHDMELL